MAEYGSPWVPPTDLPSETAPPEAPPQTGDILGKPTNRDAAPTRGGPHSGVEVPEQVDRSATLRRPSQPATATKGREGTGAADEHGEGPAADEHREETETSGDRGEGTGAAGEHGFDERTDARQEAAVKAADRVVEGAQNARAGLESIPPEAWIEVAQAADLPLDRLSDLQDELSLIERIADQLPIAGPSESLSLGLEAMTTVSVIEADLAELQDAAGSVATTSGNVVSRILARVMKVWNPAAKWLLKLISNLLTPKEWSLTGGIGIPGLAHASISVTFG